MSPVETTPRKHGASGDGGSGLGGSSPRVEGALKLRGAARFTMEYRPEDMLHSSWYQARSRPGG